MGTTDSFDATLVGRRVYQPVKATTQSQELYELLQTLGLSIDDYDVVLIGDGSGMTLKNACGWSVQAFINGTMSWYEEKMCGGANHGTNNYAELMPYIHALWQLGSSSSLRRVLIISDSELTVKCGTGEYERKKNLALWASIDWFVRQGCSITWKHIQRGTHLFNKETDDVSRKVRLSMEKFNE